MRDFEQDLLEQIKLHPSAQPQDILKQCYQAAFGAEHLLQDMERAKWYLKEEYESVKAKNIPLYESISPQVCRVNLAAWKYQGLPVLWLFRMLASSPFQGEERREMFYQYLQTAERILSTSSVAFSREEWKNYLEEYTKEGLRPVHHSQQYREKEHPAYRIVDKKFVRFFPILKQISKILHKWRNV